MLIHARPGVYSTVFRGAAALLRRPWNIRTRDTAFTLLDAAAISPQKHYGEDTREKLIRFADHFAGSDDLRLTTAALQFLRETERNIPRSHPQMARIVEIAGASRE